MLLDVMTIADEEESQLKQALLGVIGNRSRKVGWLTPEFIRAKWNFLRARWNVTFESEINHYESMLKMVEAGGRNIRCIENTQVIDSSTRQKRSIRQNCA